MKNSPTSPSLSGRILRHGERSDELTDDDVEIRARELAVIDGRAATDVTDEDRRRSLGELRGDHLPDGSLDDADGVGRLSPDPSDLPSQTGIRVQTQNDPEDQEVAERLVLEGVEEAQHDQMLAARKRRQT